MTRTDFESKRAFTMIEIVVAMAIVLVLCALTFPVISRAKKSAMETADIETLHQAWLAIELYRQDHDQSAPYGSSSQMGLPNIDGFFALMSNRHITFPQVNHNLGYGIVYYPYDRSDFIDAEHDHFSERKLASWLSYVKAHEASSILVADFQFTEGCGNLPDAQCLARGFGVLLNGTAVKQIATGEVTNPSWWEEK